MSDAQSSNQLAQSPFVDWTADQARQHLLFEIARRYKGVDPVIDARIDANAAAIVGYPGVTFIPPTSPGEPRVPLYAEGEPGVGKTTLIRSAIQEFCRITGLNFVENPPEGYELKADDFYYVTVNLSGKTNPMDIGGLPSRGELNASANGEARRRATDAGAWLASEFESRIRAVGAFAKLQVTEASKYSKGELEATELTVRGDGDQVDLVIRSVVNQLGEEVKKRGVGMALLRDGEEPQDGRLALQIKKGAQGARISVYTPVAVDQDAQYVAEMLPNRRFAMASKARFALFNFDDVANASEGVRNVLLEIAQSGRYSGVADLGNAIVTFTGNMGSEDNTNTMSEQSDAELTRVFKVRVRDTPKDWATRTALKYATVGDCQFPAFIHRFGQESGIFRDAIGDGRTARGIPKPNSRSLENALAKVLPYFQMAKASGVSPTVFTEQIRTMVKGTAGANVATRYIGFMKSMLTEAVPLADQLLTTGELDVNKLSSKLGSSVKQSERDFEFSFGAALADSFIQRVSFSQEAESCGADEAKRAKLIAQSTERLCTGLAQLEPGTMNYSLSLVNTRLLGILGKKAKNDSALRLPDSVTSALADGLAASIVKGVWGDDADRAEKEFLALTAGTNTSAKLGAAKKARP